MPIFDLMHRIYSLGCVPFHHQAPGRKGLHLLPEDSLMPSKSHRVWPSVINVRVEIKHCIVTKSQACPDYHLRTLRRGLFIPQNTIDPDRCAFFQSRPPPGAVCREFQRAIQGRANTSSPSLEQNLVLGAL